MLSYMKIEEFLMTTIDLHKLVNKLNNNCRQALEAAIGMAVARKQRYVEIEHWFLGLIDNDNTVKILLEIQIVDLNILKKDLLVTIDHFRAGSDCMPSLSSNLVDLMRTSWLMASLEGKKDMITGGHILYTLLTQADVLGDYKKISKVLENLDLNQLKKAALAEDKPKDDITESKNTTTDQQALSRFTIDLTQEAYDGKLDPIVGRDIEIRQIIDILTRRRQNNPILVGEAGVGKTALVEGLALRIVNNKVPEKLKGTRLLSLDLAALQAGAGVKGEFESRLKAVINEVKTAPDPIIIFIDEAHNLVGAGNQAGQGDAANILKPALARGELRTIAATTWAEYKKYFENDSALTRRFQPVKIEEPDEVIAINILRSLVGILEKHHRVRILDEAITAAVKLSKRYIPARQLPDKAVSLLDTACARVNLSHNSTPLVIEETEQKIANLNLEISFLEREKRHGAAHGKQLRKLNSELKALEIKLIELQTTWQREIELSKNIVQLRSDLEKQDNKAWRKTLQAATHDLKKIQGEKPLLYDCVDSQVIAAVVSEWTGIPLGRMLNNEINNTLNLKEQLQKRILGQTSAINLLAKQLQIARANLHDPRKPRGVFLLVGSSGVGKTETALVLAEMLYGGEQNMTVINMSEFKEPHKISMLTGSPAGYVGYGEGGVLTEAVRRKPYSVILLDEMEKAHPSVQEVFYQVFDQGILADGQGRQVDFKNTLILMASNIGTDAMMDLYAKHGEKLETMELKNELQPELLKVFKPAFLGRVTIVPYSPLSKNVLAGIARQKLARIKERAMCQYKTVLTFSESTVDNIVHQCQTMNTGARTIDNVINNTLLPNLSLHFLQAMAEGKTIKELNANVDKQKKLTIQLQK